MCRSTTHIQMCRSSIHCYVAIFLHAGFNCCSGLWCLSLLGVPGQVEDSLLQNWCCSWTSWSTRTLAVLTDMHHHTELPFVDEFRWVSPLHYLKRMTERCSSLVHVANRAAIFTLLLRRRVPFLHRTATCRPLFKPWVSLLSTYKTIELCFEFLLYFKVFICLLRVHTHTYICVCVCVFV